MFDVFLFGGPDMKNKYINLVIVIVVSFWSFAPCFLYVDARWNSGGQSATCDWPSEMMQNYFNFQRDAISVLLWWDVSRRLATQWGRWLFTDKVLELNWVSAIDILASTIIWGLWSIASNAITSVVLLLLAAESVIQSNIEWFAVLFKDRPIVRDYKEMLDIETSLFNVAFFRSKQMDLTKPFESDLVESLNSVIKAYQWVWLLEPWSEVKWGESMAEFLLDLFYMNTSMKHFLTWWHSYWKRALRDYNWCFWNQDSNNCHRWVAILKFTDSAIEQLEEDYKDVRTFGSCNSYANFFKETIKKTINNNEETVKNAAKDVKKAIERLKEALIGKWRWNFHNDPCKEISEYEMAQLKAYWWSDWKCGEWMSIPEALQKTKEYFNNKKAEREEKEKAETLLKMTDKPESKNTIVKELIDRLKNRKSTVEREQEWYWVFGGNVRYNSDFIYEMDSGFVAVFETTMVEFAQDQEDGIAADISDILPRGKWILDQQDAAIRETNKLNGHLQQVADYQAAN